MLVMSALIPTLGALLLQFCAGSCCKEDAAASALVVAAGPVSEAAVDGCCLGVALLVTGPIVAAPVVTALVRGSGPWLFGNDKLLVDDSGS